MLSTVGQLMPLLTIASLLFGVEKTSRPDNGTFDQNGFATINQNTKSSETKAGTPSRNHSRAYRQ